MAGSSIVRLLLLVALPLASEAFVVVTGATGRTGVSVVKELLAREKSVRCLVRNETKAAAVLPAGVDVVVVDLEDAAALGDAVAGAEGCVWCASGLAAAPRARRFRESVPQLVDEVALPAIARAIKPSRVVMLSSAGVTRPSWPPALQRALPQAFDIPIVRLNPAGILGKKARAERLLARASGGDFAVVRPVGLNEDWPRGRPVFSQGDVAVGRSNRDDVAAVLAEALDGDAVRGKTFEMLTLKGYDAPADGFEAAFARLSAAPLATRERVASYALLQQLLPGVAQDPTKLEMGRKYEEVDAGLVTRERNAPATEREKAVAGRAVGQLD